MTRTSCVSTLEAIVISFFFFPFVFERAKNEKTIEFLAFYNIDHPTEIPSYSREIRRRTFYFYRVLLSSFFFRNFIELLVILLLFSFFRRDTRDDYCVHTRWHGTQMHVRVRYANNTPHC